ncbi:MAG: PTS sugar transporter subunit IIA [candidate division WOR-3 bacterium]|nr:PTS sugar transporter subunit IIA [candidate division WOR-3 bacterium]MCX7836997.1 PTS sugar transporter subunit IIA [candidate division WOR-3 bacterium]MDW8114075.1 PTS sugar transporter subunit IIA [candidate division WOR-3 bacterium]
MKKISEILIKEGIILDLKKKEKIEVIKELSERLINLGYITDPEEFFSEILKRENLESTGIGMGIAIPHTRSRAVKDLVIVFGRSKEGVDFSSLDGKPAHLIFLIAGPEDKKSEYLFTLARLSKLLRKDEVRIELNKAKDEEEVLAIIKKYEI